MWKKICTLRCSHTIPKIQFRKRTIELCNYLYKRKKEFRPCTFLNFAPIHTRKTIANPSIPTLVDTLITKSLFQEASQKIDKNETLQQEQCHKGFR